MSRALDIRPGDVALMERASTVIIRWGASGAKPDAVPDLGMSLEELARVELLFDELDAIEATEGP